MPIFHLTERTDEPEAVTLTENHFGLNVVTTYDQEIAQPSEGLADLVKDLGANTLRFPGGSATEHYFDMTDPNSAVSADPDAPPLTPMDDFFTAAAQIGAGVQIVVPTRVGFHDSAIEALRAGEYGARRVLDSDYLDDVEAFIRTAVAQADTAGVAITALEIGNEFWGSGEMTAQEYGFIAARVAVRLDAVLEDLGLREGVRIAAQSTASASDIYSPRNTVNNYIETDDGVETLRSQAYVDKHFAGVAPGNYELVSIPGQGSAAGQLNSMIAQINAVSGAADVFDGVILHMYQRQGLDGVDDGRNYIFAQLENFETRLNRAPDADPMTYHITEWNAATGNHDDNAGLRHASMLIETMYEMVTHNVTHAQIWPLTFNAAQGTTMVDLNDDRLSIAGEMFRLMEESLPGLTPMLDWSIDDVIDIHGFESDARTVLFVSERSGAAQNNIELRTGPLLSTERYVVTLSELWDGGAGGDSAAAAPQVSYENARTIFAGSLDFDLPSWANLRIELTEVSWRDDIVRTYDAHDRIYTYGGNDVVTSGGGGDFIHLGKGTDEVWAGDGNDTIISGTDDDRLHGGNGRDRFIFETGDGDDLISDFQFGTDRMRINGVDAHSFTKLLEIEGVSLDVTGGHVRVLYGVQDSVLLTNTQPVLVADAGGRTTGTNSADYLRGGAGQDDLRGFNGADYLEDGAGRDFLRGGNGADHFVLVRDGERDVITDLQADRDRIDLSAWDVAQFADLEMEVEYHLNGEWAGRGYIRYADEELRIDGMDDAMLSLLDADVISI